MELKGKKIYFLGDSITEGVGASDAEHCYVSVFGKLSGTIVKVTVHFMSNNELRSSGERRGRDSWDFCRRCNKKDDAIALTLCYDNKD